MDQLKETSDVGLKFIKLDIDTVKVRVLSDAVFCKLTGLKGQIGFIVFMVDGQNHAILVHYGSSRCHRVSRSVMASQGYALVHAFDWAYMHRETLDNVLGRQITLDVFVYSGILLSVIVEDSVTAKRKLPIDVCALTES